jgi:hypothetical protein
MGAQTNLENKMDEMLVKKAPFQIPENGRKALVEYAPILAIIGGILSAVAAWGLWRAGHAVNELVDLANSYARAVGVDTVNNLDVFFYAGVAALAVQAVLMFVAYSPLKERSKRGWDILLLSTLINFVYGLSVAVSDYGTVGNLIGSVIGVVIGLYILAQIRGHYGKASKKEAVNS